MKAFLIKHAYPQYLTTYGRAWLNSQAIPGYSFNNLYTLYTIGVSYARLHGFNIIVQIVIYSYDSETYTSTESSGITKHNVYHHR